MSASDREVRVLVVDDDPVHLDFISTGLSGLGIRVSCARGVSEAFAKLQHASCDVVLVSLRLPGHGGVELLRQVRRNHPGVQVVVMAWPPEEAIARGSLSEGVFAYLLRPLDGKRLAQCVWSAGLKAAAQRERADPGALVRESGVQGSEAAAVEPTEPR